MSDNKRLREIDGVVPGSRPAPAMHVPDAGQSQPEVERFLDSMWSERGLSENTLAAYRADLSGLARWLDGQGVELMLAQREHLLAFLA
ncbi:MAG TPA: site-specific integrase, partial [Gammaproteobacteria bacterium]|nr:site-specific integrase [Gammaproteobacteria bacterium]